MTAAIKYSEVNATKSKPLIRACSTLIDTIAVVIASVGTAGIIRMNCVSGVIAAARNVQANSTVNTAEMSGTKIMFIKSEAQLT